MRLKSIFWLFIIVFTQANAMENDPKSWLLKKEELLQPSSLTYQAALNVYGLIAGTHQQREDFLAELNSYSIPEEVKEYVLSFYDVNQQILKIIEFSDQAESAEPDTEEFQLDTVMLSTVEQIRERPLSWLDYVTIDKRHFLKILDELTRSTDEWGNQNPEGDLNYFTGEYRAFLNYVVSDEHELSKDQRKIFTQMLSRALRRGDKNLARFLIANGACIAQDDFYHQTPVATAIEKNLLEELQVLCDERKARDEAKESRHKKRKIKEFVTGNSRNRLRAPLSLAIKHGNVEALEKLAYIMENSGIKIAKFLKKHGPLAFLMGIDTKSNSSDALPDAQKQIEAVRYFLDLTQRYIKINDLFEVKQNGARTTVLPLSEVAKFLFESVTDYKIDPIILITALGGKDLGELPSLRHAHASEVIKLLIEYADSQKIQLMHLHGLAKRAALAGEFSLLQLLVDKKLPVDLNKLLNETGRLDTLAQVLAYKKQTHNACTPRKNLTKLRALIDFAKDHNIILKRLDAFAARCIERGDFQIALILQDGLDANFMPEIIDRIQGRDEKGRTLLWRYVGCGQNKSARNLIKFAELYCIDLPDLYGALGVAIDGRKNREMITLLLSKILAYMSVDELMLLAAQNVNFNMLNILQKEFQIDIREKEKSGIENILHAYDETGSTLLLRLMVSNKHEEVRHAVEFAQKNGIELPDIYSVLELARNTDNVEMIGFLLPRTVNLDVGSFLNAPDIHGNTLLTRLLSKKKNWPIDCLPYFLRNPIDCLYEISLHYNVALTTSVCLQSTFLEYIYKPDELLRIRKNLIDYAFQRQ